MVTQVTTANFSSTTLTALATPSITSITVTDNTYTATGATSVALTGGYIKIIGSSFVSGATVYVDSTPATSVAFISSTQLNVQVPGSASSSYVVYVINPDGSIAVRVNGINYSATPTWVSSSAQSSVGGTINIQLSASSDSTTTYALASGSSLPSGLTLTSGGLISGTVTGTGVVVYNFSVVATDLETQKSTQSFSITITFTDPYFTYNALLLNGETSVTPFISDASTNNFGLTIVGDTKPVLFNPYQGDGYYSVLFDGASYLAATPATSVTIGTSDFCFEGWGYWTSFNYGTYGAALCSLSGTSSELMIRGTKTSASTTTANWFSNINGLTYIPSAMYNSGMSFGTLYLYRWHHLAVQRVSGTWYFYIDGVQVGTTATGDASLSVPYTVCYVGNDIGSANGYMAGYVSNVRLTVGSAPYTTTGFTVPTSPLTNIANTKFLLAQSNRYVDKSVNNSVMTTSGSAIISQTIPFTASSSYSTYGSAYFDGTGDYLTTPITSSGPLDFGSGNWTVEAWVMYTGASLTGGYRNFLTFCNDSGLPYIQIGTKTSSGYVFVQEGTSVTVPWNAEGTTLLTSNVWHHIAAVRNSNNIYLYLDGVSQGSVAYSGTHQTFAKVQIGSLKYNGSIIQDWTGYIADVRIVKGTAVYTTAFTPPTAQLTAVANTSLLTLQYNGGANNQGIIDNSNFNNIITRNGNTSQGTFSPYSVTGWSNYFNTDYISGISSSASPSGTGSWTIECWFYQTARSSGTGRLVDGGVQWTTAVLSTGEIYAETSNGTGIKSVTGTIVTLNTWHHMALVKNSSTVTLYYDGVAQGSSWTESLSLSAVTMNIAGTSAGVTTRFLGYISNARIVNGTTLYTTTFTPSTTPLTPITNTSLLTCQSNRFIDNGPINASLTINGTPTVQAYSPFGSISEATPISYSNYFDGSGDYLATPDNVAFTLSSNDFTFECWVYPTSITNGNNNLLVQWGNGNAWIFRYVAAGRPHFSGGATSVTGTTTAVVVNQWNHIAITRTSTTVRLFVNGVMDATTGTIGALTDGASQVTIGAYSDGTSEYVTGYISNLRLINGTSLYTSNFTPSTTPLTAIANTSLLTCQSTRMIDNSANNFTITANGDTKPYKYNPFGYTAQSATRYTPSIHGGSAYFDGTGDYLSNSTGGFTNFGTGDFTVEYWLYYTAALNSNFQQHVGTALSGSGIAFGTGTSGALYATTSTTGYSTGYPIVVNQWQHIAWTRANGLFKAFLNGTQVNTTGTFTSTNFTELGVGIGGQRSDGAYPLAGGYISDIRATKGAVYTSNFVPPTQTLTNYSATYPASLLLNFNNGGIIDQHGTNVVETVGNAQLSTAVKKYGNASIYFDGTGDYLYSLGQSYVLGTGDFTIECWAYATGGTNNGLFQIASTAGGFGGVTGLALGVGTSNKFSLYYGSGGNIASTGTAANQNTWNHFAVVRNSGVTKVYLNGVLDTTIGTSGAVTDTTNYTGTYLTVGGYYSSTYVWQGYIDDLRITKGVARYTTTFTPPSTVQTL
jgi:hypothetical protein